MPNPPTTLLSLDLLTDFHYADKPQTGSHAYREIRLKTKEAVSLFKEQKRAFQTLQPNQQSRSLSCDLAGVHLVILDACFCTLAAMIEGSGPEDRSYSLLHILNDETLKFEDSRRQKIRILDESLPALLKAATCEDQDSSPQRPSSKFRMIVKKNIYRKRNA